MSDTAGYPKYQYSFFVNKDDQIVVRAENSEEFKNSVEKVKNMFPKEVKPVVTTQVSPVQVQTDTQVEICFIHKVALEDKVSKLGKPYKGHAIGPGKMCFGK